jgi:hypothetical protein
VYGSAADGAATITVSVGLDPSGKPLGQDEAVLARTPEGKYYLVWRDTRMWIPKLNAVSAAFGYNTENAVNVSGTWINSVKAGPDFSVRKVDGFGERTRYTVGTLGPVRVGQLFQTESSSGVASRYYVADRNGLAMVSTVAGELILADLEMDPTGGRVSQSMRVSTATIGSAPRSNQQVFDERLPQEPGQMKQVLVKGGSDGPLALCANYQVQEANRSSSTVYLTSADQIPQAKAHGRTADGQQVKVIVASSQAAVVRNLPHDGQLGPSFYLVTDQGAKFPVPPNEGSATHVLEVLGYGGVEAVPVPDSILALLPTGPALDQSVVNVEHPVTGS